MGAVQSWNSTICVIFWDLKDSNQIPGQLLQLLLVKTNPLPGVYKDSSVKLRSASSDDIREQTEVSASLPSSG
jgi:hypothetical protein